jgi:hypothetical protein
VETKLSSKQRRIRQQSCDGKTNYSGWGIALRVIQSNKWQNVAIYRCRFCQGIHIGRRTRDAEITEISHDLRSQLKFKVLRRRG